MSSEQIIEEGTVLSASEGSALVELQQIGSCRECTAKIVCKPKDEGIERVITAADPFGVKAGDHVRISVRGRDIVKITLVLYVVPLILLIGASTAGMEFFIDTGHGEFYSFLTAAAFTSCYFAFIFFFKRIFGNTKDIEPKIISVWRKE